MAEVSIYSANDPYSPTPGMQDQAFDVSNTLAPEITNVSAFGDVHGASAPSSVAIGEPTPTRDITDPTAQRERDVAGPGE